MLSQARHPVLEVQQGFVPNDVVMDDKRRFLPITGPNMGGKSTYLRTVALVSILAQAGSFVPPEKARLGLIDRIFTRVGASDDLEEAFHVHDGDDRSCPYFAPASSKSLLLLDEIGRGTSTFDGLSIAWAVTEDVQSSWCAKSSQRTINCWAGTRSTGLQTFTFKSHRAMAPPILHTVADGPCDESYGVQVAALAITSNVVERATDLLAFLEQQAQGAQDRCTKHAEQGQSSLLGYFAAAAMQTNEPKAPSMTDAQEAVLSEPCSVEFG